MDISKEMREEVSQRDANASTQIKKSEGSELNLSTTKSHVDDAYHHLLNAEHLYNRPYPSPKTFSIL